jgi:UMF1 family MFS transporter
MSAANASQARSWKQLIRDRKVLSWALYDWANSAFSTTVMAGFFPIFFKKYWSAGMDVNLSTYQLGFANSFSSGILACLSPIIGAIADQGSAKKRALLVFSGLGIVMTGALSMVAQGDWQMAIVLYMIASIGFAGANSFYDSLIVLVAPPADTNQVSALGFSLGYLGGGVLFALNVLMTLKPSLFGFRDATQAVQISFVTVSVWWAVFTLPLLFFVHEEQRASPGYWQLAKQGIKEVLHTFKEIRLLKNVALFLIAYFFYIDGVNTIITMAVDYGLSLGFPSESLIVALLLTQFVGFPAALLYGLMTQKIGARLGLYLAIAIYACVCVFAYWMNSPMHFYVLAAVIGLVQGGIQSVSRSVFAHMIPKEKSGEFFGFFNMLGKFSSMLGPYLVGWVAITTGDSRLSILSIILLFIIGAGILAFVRLPPIDSK